MRLTEGRAYVTRDGTIVPSVSFLGENLTYCFVCRDPQGNTRLGTASWMVDGTFWNHDKPHALDILSEHNRPLCTKSHDEVTRDEWRERVAKAMGW